jgi:hypothetical protein
VTPVSEIKLIRTDTTLDLSQKAEKVCSFRFSPSAMENHVFPARMRDDPARPFFRKGPSVFGMATTNRSILTWRGRGRCSPKRVINKARRLIEYTALHAAVCGRLWL